MLGFEQMRNVLNVQVSTSGIYIFNIGFGESPYVDLTQQQMSGVPEACQNRRFTFPQVVGNKHLELWYAID